MSIQAFLVIPQSPGTPVVGEAQSTDTYFSTTFPASSAVIPVSDFEFSVENPTTIGSAATGAGAGKAKLNGLVIHKSVDKSSSGLFSASVTGEHFAVVQLYIRQSGAPKGAPFLAYEFQMVFITNIAWSGSSGDEQLTEAVTLLFGAMAIVYQATNPDGSPAATVRSGWSEITNSASVQDTVPLKS